MQGLVCAAATNPRTLPSSIISKRKMKKGQADQRQKNENINEREGGKKGVLHEKMGVGKVERGNYRVSRVAAPAVGGE